MLQRDVAAIVGCDTTTVHNWEKGRTRPPLRFLPRIIRFLEYDPFPSEAETLGEQLLKYRRDRGMTQKELARRIRIDPGTLSRLERSKDSKVFRTVLQKVQSYLSR